MTSAEQNEFKKKQRSLKNRLSALKSREKKRAQMADLECQVAALKKQVRELQEQNNELRRGIIIPRASERRGHDSAQACSNSVQDNPAKRRRKTIPLPSLDELFPEQTKLSNVKKLELCAHNGGSAVPATRSSHKKNNGCAVLPSALRDAMDDFAFDIFDDLDNSNPKSDLFDTHSNWTNESNGDIFSCFT